MKFPRKSSPLTTLIFSLLTRSSITLSLGVNRFYNERDNVLQVDHLNNWRREPGRAKLVLFMNGFCNDSQSFVPTYTQLARNLYRWNRILGVYVIDCAIELFGQDCRRYKIPNTPTVRLFPPSYTRQDLGTTIDMEYSKVSLIKDQVANHLSQVKDFQVTGSPIFKLLTRQDNVSTVFDVSSRSHLVLVHQPRLSDIGRNTLLDLLPFPQVEVRILEDRRIFLNFGVESDRYWKENLVVLDRVGKRTYLSARDPTDEANVFAVERFVQPPPQKELEQHQPVSINASVRQLIFDNYRTRSIYLADLERAIDHILKVQLLQVPHFQDKNLIVLRNIMSLLHHLNPLRTDEGKIYINDINVIVGSHFNGDADFFRRFVLEDYADKSYYGERYVGCIASQPGLRGFNCSLWELFHYLTVAASRPPIRFKAGAVLWTLHGYANFFMGCPVCYQHFWSYAEERKIDNVKTHDEEILWLWEGHNHFNKKLAGGRNEDPMFPKKQFPLEQDCPQCRNSQGEWQTDEVLKHLKEIYRLENLSWFGLSTPLSYLHNADIIQRPA